MLVRKSFVPFDMTEVPTKTITINNPITMSVEAGTNGYQGGDGGYGCITYFRFQSATINAFTVSTFEGDQYKQIEDGCSGFDVSVMGDFQLDCMIEALEFITTTLKEQREEHAE